MLERILLPLDTTHEAERSLPYVAARARGLHQPLVLLTVIPDLGVVNPIASLRGHGLHEVTERRRVYAQSYLNTVRERLEKDGLVASAVVAVSEPAEGILKTGDEQGAGLSRWRRMVASVRSAGSLAASPARSYTNLRSRCC